MLELIRTAWPLLAPSYRWKIPFILAGFFVLSLLEMIGIAAIFPAMIFFIDPFSEQASHFVPFFEIVLPGVAQENLGNVLLGALVIVFIIKNIATVVVNRILYSITQNYVRKHAVDSFNRYARIPFLHSQNYDLGQLLFIVNSTGNIVYTTMSNTLIIMVADFITISCILTILLIANPIASGISAVIIFSFGILVFLFTQNRLVEIGHIQRATIEATTKQVRNAFSSFKELRVSGTEDYFQRRYADKWQDLARSNVNQQTYVMSTRYFIEIGMIVALTAYVVISASGSSTAELIAEVGLFGLASLRILPATSRIFSSAQTIMTAKAAVSLVHNERTRFSGLQLEQPSAAAHALRIPEQVDVTIEKLSFEYPETNRATIDNISLDIPANTSLGIVGASGAGKTTLADILLGVLPPTSGRMIANGEDIAKDLKLWRKHVSYVPQSVGFVSGTLRENIAFGIEPELIDFVRVDDCVDAAQLGPVIAKLPKGLDTQAGETGQFLSGGERQRIGIARALYRQARLIVFDEATSALDVETERLIADVTLKLTRQASVVIIAHRLKTIQSCDRILYLNEGKTAGLGSFDTLRDTVPGFRRLVELSEFGSVRNAQ